jgi:hypothetical protein
MLLLAGVAQAEQHALVTRVDGASVRMAIPMDGGVGSKPPLGIQVTPDASGTPPSKIRARLGMPDHGHWITEESSSPMKDTIVHQGDLPMAGLYRLRVWLDYPDGRVVRTGADFLVDDLKTHVPTPAPR